VSRATATARMTSDAIWEVLRSVPDPEMPVVSVVDLGIVRGVDWNGDTLVVSVTPTYSGCPATEVIGADIERALRAAGIAAVRVETRLSPAWTTDWLSDAARRRLNEFGIVPPGPRAPSGSSVVDIRGLRAIRAVVACPRCASRRTSLVARCGSTPCKAQYRCDDCGEPFDYFRPH
jgi:ring-1,2-phenylacetyl-CoA epoxidase subunit PaaD